MIVCNRRVTCNRESTAESGHSHDLSKQMVCPFHVISLEASHHWRLEASLDRLFKGFLPHASGPSLAVTSALPGLGWGEFRSSANWKNWESHNFSKSLTC